MFDIIEEVFTHLKDNDSASDELLKKLVRNFQLIFPVKFESIDPVSIRRRLESLYNESVAREDIV